MEQNSIQYYRFVWFRRISGDRIEEKLQQMMQKHPEASNAVPDLGAIKGGYGMIVLREYIPTLRELMQRIFRRSVIGLIYPSSNRRPLATALYSEWFSNLDHASEIATALKEYAPSTNSLAFDSEPTYHEHFHGGRIYSFVELEDSILTRNFFPEDEEERERQDLLHCIWSRFENALFLAPTTFNEGFVLDIGCGGGAWAIQVADAHPSWQVEGFDVSRIIPSDQPPNCYLYLEDCNILRNERNRFDFIHVRGMSVCVDDWPSLIYRCYRALKPGGYLEIKDVIPFPRRYPPKSNAAPVSKKLRRLIKEGARRHHRDILAIKKIDKWMCEQGFHGLTKVTNEWPLRPQVRDTEELGDSIRTSCIDGVKVLLYSLVSCAPEEKEIYLMQLRNEIMMSQTFVHAITIYGRKPRQSCN